jgi:hypothetical protein
MEVSLKEEADGGADEPRPDRVGVEEGLEE